MMIKFALSNYVLDLYTSQEFLRNSFTNLYMTPYVIAVQHPVAYTESTLFCSGS
jgi:hypothetical protein